MSPLQLMEMVICAGGEARTVYLDAEGNEHAPPHDCRTCSACNLPGLALPGPTPAAARPAAWLFAAYPPRGESIDSPRQRARAQSRAPPHPLSRMIRPMAADAAAGAGFASARTQHDDHAVVVRATVRTYAA